MLEYHDQFCRSKVINRSKGSSSKLGGRTGIALFLGVVLGLAGCVDNEVRALDAQNASEVSPEGGAGAEPAIAPEDTLTRTAAEAAAMSLAASAAEEAASVASTDSATADTTVQTPQVRYNAGEDPSFAARYGWPVQGPAPLPGSILPNNRIVCYYGNPNSARMGALGQYPKAEMLQRLQNQIGAWETADPNTPVKPCLHMVAVVAQGEPGTSGHYRSIMRDTTVQMVYDWAREVNGIFIVDIQVGTDDIRNILPRFEWMLKNPDVHLAVDPEFYMKDGTPPGRKIGTMDAADINYVSDYLANLVRENNLPPKVLIIHRFTRGMVTNSANIRLRPEVQVVLHMDGWGAAWLKRDSYRDYIVREPVQYTGFKIFYGNDTKNGTLLMQPADLLKLRPTPIYVQYQ
jgi:hypothetical protein